MQEGHEFRSDDYRNRLETKHWRAAQDNAVRRKRETNIVWIKNLSRKELEYDSTEKQVLIEETDEGEKLIIQYPGKEVVRDDDGKRPWDFRPRILFPDGSYGQNLSFGGVWDTLFESFEELGDEGIEPARVLASLFYRMAFMIDHTRDCNVETQTRMVNESSDSLLAFDIEQHDTDVLRYEPPEEIIQDLTEVIPTLGDMSLKAFLHYNDLMAWNEDCKYYYRGTDGAEEKWDWPRTGRINTLLTHISILGIITGDLRLSSVLNKFQSGRGVAPVNQDETEKITDNIIGME